MGNRVTANLCDGGNADHWHFVVRPETSDQVREFFRQLTVMHTMRWHAHYKTSSVCEAERNTPLSRSPLVRYAPLHAPCSLYQGRFKSFPIQSDGHLLTVMRYVERNQVRANLFELAEDWNWSSAFARRQRADERRWLAIPKEPPLPRNWRS